MARGSFWNDGYCWLFTFFTLWRRSCVRMLSLNQAVQSCLCEITVTILTPSSDVAIDDVQQVGVGPGRVIVRDELEVHLQLGFHLFRSLYFGIQDVPQHVI